MGNGGISSTYDIYFSVQYLHFKHRRPDLWERGSYASGLSLVYFSIHSDAWLFLVDTGVEVGVVYTDYYTYLRQMEFAGRFGTGVYIYVL